MTQTDSGTGRERENESAPTYPAAPPALMLGKRKDRNEDEALAAPGETMSPLKM